jgi:hypothetical protein
MRRQRAEGQQAAAQRLEWVRERRAQLDRAKSETVKTAGEVVNRAAPASSEEVKG